MNKEVLLTITGLQMGQENEEECTEIIAPGEYYFRNGKHYFVYEEVQEDFQETTKCMIKLDASGKLMELTRKGLTNSHMVFESGKQNVTYYTTPYGSIFIGINGKSIAIEEEDDHMKVLVKYGLEMNGEFLADCEITIAAKNRNTEGFHIVK